jgi:hypothetical protein
LKVNPTGFQVYLLDVPAYFPSQLRQESAQGSQTLASRGFAHLCAEKQTEVSSQAAIDGIMEGQRQGCGRRYPRWNAALKLSLLSKECRTSEQGYTSTDEPAYHPPVEPNVGSETTAVVPGADVHWLAS